MKIDWIEYNKDFNHENAEELKNISDYLLIKYIHTNSNDSKEKIGILSFYKCANGNIGILNGHSYCEYFDWTKILKYCPLEI